MIKLTILCADRNGGGGEYKKILVNPIYIKMAMPINKISSPEAKTAVYVGSHNHWCSETVEEIEEMLKVEATKDKYGDCDCQIWKPRI